MRMHADEFDITVDLVGRLVAGRFPRWAGLPIRPVASAGTVNAMYRLGDDLAVRLPRVSWGAGGLETERAWQPRLAPHLPVAIPELVGEGQPAQGYPWNWSVVRWLPGANPDPDRLAAPGPLAADLAEFVTAFRKIDLPDAPSAYRGGPLAALDEPTHAAIAELGPAIDGGAALAAWDAAMRAPRWEGPDVWVHADLLPGNLLTVDGRLSGVIDFATVGRGDPACDLIVAWNLLPATVRPAFRTAVGADDATWARARGRALSIALIALPYYRDANPLMAANARHTIEAVLTAPGPWLSLANRWG